MANPEGATLHAPFWKAPISVESRCKAYTGEEHTTRKKWLDLQDALCACDKRGDGKAMNARALGRKFREWERRILDGKRLVSAGMDRTNMLLWRVETMSA